MNPGSGNEAQVRIVAEQVARAVIAQWTHDHPLEPRRLEIPAPLKWAAGIMSAIMAAVAIASVSWGASTLNGLQVMVARIDERQRQDTTNARLDKIEERLERLEQRRASDGRNNP